jgi:hypothetical protein
MTKTAFMAFCSEAPLVGLDPHPGWAPQEEISSYDATGYFEALGAYETLAAAKEDIQSDYDARLQAVEDGDLEDADEADQIFEVTIHDDGRVEVIHDTPRYVFATFTIKEAYEAFGMEMPTP